MSIPANLQSEASFLQSQVTANTPLANAPQAQIRAMQLNATQLVADTDTALSAAATLPNGNPPPGVAPLVTGTLDTWQAPVAVLAIIAGVNATYTSAQNQSDIALFRGIVGRVLSNLNQL